MKTFEERYTAWIDGQLEGSALLAFEQELARRSAAGETEADRTDTLRLRHLLRDHLEAPTLNNAEFFSHQLRERINAERMTITTRRPEGAAGRGGLLALFPWSVARIAGLGAACLFVAGALYYGLEPGTPPAGGDQVAVATPRTHAQPSPEVAENQPPAAPTASDHPDHNLFAERSPTPAPLPDLLLPDDAPDIQVHGTVGATATGLLYPKPNVDVLWTNGLQYLPDLATSPASAPSPGASVVP